MVFSLFSTVVKLLLLFVICCVCGCCFCCCCLLVYLLGIVVCLFTCLSFACLFAWCSVFVCVGSLWQRFVFVVVITLLLLLLLLISWLLARLFVAVLFVPVSSPVRAV